MAKRTVKKVPAIAVIQSSGNVFADMGVTNAEEELAKAQLATHIRQTIQRRRLTQVQAAGLMGLDQPKVSALMTGRLGGFSSDRLMRFLTTLGQDVEIVVRTAPQRRDRGRLRVLDMTSAPPKKKPVGTRKGSMRGDAPRLGRDWFERAEIRKGGHLVRKAQGASR